MDTTLDLKYELIKNEVLKYNDVNSLEVIN